MTLRSYIRFKVRVRVSLTLKIRVRVSLTLTLTKPCLNEKIGIFFSITKWGDFLKNGGIFCNFSCSISVYL